MANAFTRKLDNWNPLWDNDQANLEAISENVANVERRQHLVREGDDPHSVFLVIEGWVFRYKLLPNGNATSSPNCWPATCVTFTSHPRADGSCHCDALSGQGR